MLAVNSPKFLEIMKHCHRKVGKYARAFVEKLNKGGELSDLGESAANEKLMNATNSNTLLDNLLHNANRGPRRHSFFDRFQNHGGTGSGGLNIPSRTSSQRSTSDKDKDSSFATVSINTHS
eukprot:CAMPEP_0206499412 /NCGR_PEP_ID=MMETSP0324_2-20121206/51701_1 /ASSEMBLY_ACC=CAM_ASM_000836 /TAXON_ID=2866 /ORGANISM="Crypthecodinium cohnii, Strain Seligo" /LENGTH=120 /DNA_ID=CAMNT_0053986039 /DNA_START=1 /DNA_END=363 /DNA_ORIENTATION=+